tara:strand:+ start:3039 stop:3296 length:258 start_codon:yes stop_codon:yes gene_type:complete
MSNKIDQNEFIDRLWRDKRKTTEYPVTLAEAMRLSYEANLMLDWFYANHSDLYMTTYARGLRLARMDMQDWKLEAEYLTFDKAEQ